VNVSGNDILILSMLRSIRQNCLLPPVFRARYNSG